MKFTFTWDETKAKANLKNHGLSFDEAASSFYDPNAKVFFDKEHSDLEDRFLLLGYSEKSRILMISHCLRQTEFEIRIISARKATPKECRNYEVDI